MALPNQILLTGATWSQLAKTDTLVVRALRQSTSQLNLNTTNLHFQTPRHTVGPVELQYPMATMKDSSYALLHDALHDMACLSFCVCVCVCHTRLLAFRISNLSAPSVTMTSRQQM